ncbi:hypothetical protein J3A98_003353 [Pseudomonas sp. BP6]|nr:hypothetical protein [Pseudomonas sp. BP6]MBP2288369.1 hypothetical protein [Pseudomonas sp. BP7]
MLARSKKLPRIGLIHRCNRVPMFKKQLDSVGESIHRSGFTREYGSGGNGERRVEIGQQARPFRG